MSGIMSESMLKMFTSKLKQISELSDDPSEPEEESHSEKKKKNPNSIIDISEEVYDLENEFPKETDLKESKPRK